jgi:hypothetical protein
MSLLFTASSQAPSGGKFAPNIGYYGKSGIIIRSYGELFTDRYGTSSCSAEYSTRAPDYRSLPGMGARHPVFTGIKMTKRRLAFEGAFAVAYCEYEGLEATGSFGFSDDQSPPVYELVRSVSDDPIETHPRFTQSNFAGTPQSPQNGAVFLGPDGLKSTDPKVAKFSHFAYQKDDGTESALFGVRTYLNSTEPIWRETITYRASRTSWKNSLGDVGRFSDPGGDPPKAPTGYQWMLLSLQSVERGDAVVVTREWQAVRASAERAIIYGS